MSFPARSGVAILQKLYDDEVLEQEHIEKLLEIAITSKSPVNAYNLAIKEYSGEFAHNNGYVYAIARATRWLATVKKNEGDEAFARHATTLRLMAQEEEVQT